MRLSDFSLLAYQEVLIDFNVAIVVSQVGGAVEGGEPLLIALVHLSTIVEKMMQLHKQG